MTGAVALAALAAAEKAFAGIEALVEHLRAEDPVVAAVRSLAAAGRGVSAGVTAPLDVEAEIGRVHAEHAAALELAEQLLREKFHPEGSSR